MKFGAMTAGALVLAMAGAAQAQDATPAPATGPTQAIIEEGPRWGVFSRDPRTMFLIDMADLQRNGDAVVARVARVRIDSPEGDFSHVLDTFEILCRGDQSRMVTSSDIEADGVSGDAYPADEPLTAIRSGSFDEMIQTMACEDRVPAGGVFPSIRAYIEAGRP